MYFHPCLCFWLTQYMNYQSHAAWDHRYPLENRIYVTHYMVKVEYLWVSKVQLRPRFSMTFQIVIWDFNWEMWYQIWYRDMGYISEIGYEIWLVEVSWSQNVPMYCSAKKFRYNHETSNTHILDPISDMYSISRYEIWYHISQLKSHILIWNVIEKRGLRISQSAIL